MRLYIPTPDSYIELRKWYSNRKPVKESILCENILLPPREFGEYGLEGFSLLNSVKDDNRPNCYWLKIGQLYGVM